MDWANILLVSLVPDGLLEGVKMLKGALVADGTEGWLKRALP